MVLDKALSSARVDDCGTCAGAYLTLHPLAWGLSIVCSANLG